MDMSLSMATYASVLSVYEIVSECDKMLSGMFSCCDSGHQGLQYAPSLCPGLVSPHSVGTCQAGAHLTRALPEEATAWGICLSRVPDPEESPPSFWISLPSSLGLPGTSSEDKEGLALESHGSGGP